MITLTIMFLFGLILHGLRLLINYTMLKMSAYNQHTISDSASESFNIKVEARVIKLIPTKQFDENEFEPRGKEIFLNSRATA